MTLVGCSGARRVPLAHRAGDFEQVLDGRLERDRALRPDGLNARFEIGDHLGTDRLRDVPPSRSQEEIRRSYAGQPRWRRAVAEHVACLTDAAAERLSAELGS